MPLQVAHKVYFREAAAKAYSSLEHDLERAVLANFSASEQREELAALKKS